MPDQATSQLPGIYFQQQVAPPPQVLPRMDIAGFVGVAAQGPLHTPVPIEDMSRFQEIFGGDLPLAWDAEHGEQVRAYLAPTVAAFFHNGGRRCWVVRVADAKTQVHRFPLTGLIRTDTWSNAAARARCAGSWADKLRVGTVLVRERISLVTEPVSAKLKNYQIDVLSTSVALRRGDLLEITFNSGGNTDDLILFLFVDKVSAQKTGGVIVTGENGFWFLPEPEVSSPPCKEEEWRWLTSLSEEEGLNKYNARRNSSPPITKLVVQRLTFEMLVWREGGLAARLGDLAFHESHPRFWGNLPTDEQLFRLPQGKKLPVIPAEIEALLREADHPRFPLAGPEKPDKGIFYLPVGMPDIRYTRAPVVDDLVSGGLARDWLEQFNPDIFLDPDLAHVGHGALLREAEHKYYIRGQALQGIHSLLPVDEVTLLAVPDLVHRGWTREIPRAETQKMPRALRLLATPPILDVIPAPDALERYLLSWSAVKEATEYVLQRDVTPDFNEPVTLYTGLDTTFSMTVSEPCPQRYYFRVRALRYAEISPWSNTRTKVLPPVNFADGTIHPPRHIQLELRFFGSPAEGMQLFWWEEESGDSLTSEAKPQFEVQKAKDADFESARTFYHGIETGVELPAHTDAVYYYRVRAHRADQPGPWSNTITQLPTSLSVQTLQTIEQYEAPQDGQNKSLKEQLLDVHKALLDFCAARADMLALLSLPRHYREADMLEHQQALTHLFQGDTHRLSYAALYHPWLAFTAGNFIPAVGAICGTMAKHTLEQGAWLSSANQPLAGVVALDPDLEQAAWQRLTLAQINLVRQVPRGFIVFNDDTLSRSTELQAVNVRRLLILLRRLALREGNTYVFEPNDVDFRDKVRQRFERLLSDLYVQGAFTGTSPDAAYRVIVDNSVNTPQSLDLGRFIIELRVAPSRPLAFINIRLTQTGPEQLAIQEV